MAEFSKMNIIDMVSADSTTGHAILHLVVEGEWTDMANKMEWIRRRLNIYGAFVLTGQLAELEKYRGLSPKILMHCEVAPPLPILMMLANMRSYLLSESIDMAVTVGRDVTKEAPLPFVD